ncbi:peptidase S49 family protein, partial [Vibrio parahaemolyticus VPTS-2010_2]
HANHVW